jgi:hypothetical protein
VTADPPPPDVHGLPARPPRPFAVHWLVDAAIVFVGSVIVASFWGVPLVPLALASLGVGLVVAPWTRRAEIRALAARRSAEPDG